MRLARTADAEAAPSRHARGAGFFVPLLVGISLALPLSAACSKGPTDSPFVKPSETRPASTQTVPMALLTEPRVHLVTPVATSSLAGEPSAAPSPACDASSARVEQTTYPGTAVVGDVPLRVFLPPCYEQSSSTYPVLYLLHGYPYDESHWDEVGIDEMATDAMAQGTLPKFIIVMPRQPDPIFRSTDGGPGSYETEMIEGLVPYVDRVYRTRAEADATAIGGISRGGIWALEIGLRNPDVFGVLIVLSPSLASNHAREPYDPFRIVASGEEMPRHIALMCGVDDGHRIKLEQLSAAMDSAGVEHELLIVPGGHDDATWRDMIPSVLELLGQVWSALP